MNLIVDLDNSLLKTDLFKEGIIKLTLKKPWLLFKLIFKVIKSKSECKEFVSKEIKINPKNLPYNNEVINQIKYYKEKHFKIILSTGANSNYAEKVAEHLGFFDSVISSNKTFNNTGVNKLKKFISLNLKDFIYIGDSKSDMKIWEYCKNAIVVNISKSKITKLEEKNVNIIKSINNQESSFLRFLLKQIRIHQWAKNILIFFPTLAAHKIFNSEALVNCLYSFLAFSFLASSIYIYNDIIDLNKDREHKEKKNRPLASGNFNIIAVIFILILFSISSLMIAYAVSKLFFLLAIVYVILNILYSSFLKQKIIIDIILLTSFYLIRLESGYVINNIEFSVWLTGFLFFVFLSLGSMKRYIDLLKYKEKSFGRSYIKSDIYSIQTLGISSGLLGSIILILYSVSENVVKLYSSPNLLLFIIPLYIYWVMRFWILASRKVISSDPVKFAVKDFGSYLVLFTASLLILLSTI